MDSNLKKKEQNRCKLIMNYFSKLLRVRIRKCIKELIKTFISLYRTHPDIPVPQDTEPHLSNIPQQEPDLYEEADVKES